MQFDVTGRRDMEDLATHLRAKVQMDKSEMNWWT
jgi:hypothetical protein